MSLSIEQLQFLASKGLSIQEVIEFAGLTGERSKGAERQARYRARKKGDNNSSVTGDVTRYATECDADAPPPSPPSFPPTPPQTPPTPPPPYKQPRARKAGSDVFRPEGVADQVWSDFLEVRKAKRAPLTATALAAIQREAEDVGWTLPQAIERMAKDGWRGFKAAWIRKEQTENERKSSHGGKQDGAALAIDRRLAELARTPERPTACDGYGTGQGPIAAIADMR